jgi:RimJ/RimL family protein N-acetyltransferase
MSGFPAITGPVLETQRLILRPPNGADFEGFAAMSLDAEHVQFVGGRLERATAWRVWCTLAGAWMIRGFSMFSVIEKDTGAWVGRIGPWYPEGWPGREIGWGVARAMGGKGYALEAATACMDYVFDQLGWDDVIHVINRDNAPSIALARRLGSTNLGPTTMPPPFQDQVVDAWGQTRAQWQARRAGL